MNPPTVEAAPPAVAVERSGRHERQVQRSDRQNGLGGRHLGIGLTFSGAFIAVFLLWRFAVQWEDHPSPLPSLLAWVILLIATPLALMSVQRLSGE
ncbi:MAG TPA: hypothetical protein VFC59_03240, partial [Cryobacterium sp.]|nr:hypothetical protein [Cryobacterium sp.]